MGVGKTGIGAGEVKIQESKIKFKDAYWIDEDGEKIRIIPKGKEITLFIETKDYAENDIFKLKIETNNKKVTGMYFVDSQGKICIKNFKL